MSRFHAIALGVFLGALGCSTPAWALNRFAACDSLDDYLTDVVPEVYAHTVGAEKCSVTTGRMQAAALRMDVLLGADRSPRADPGLERSMHQAADDLTDGLVGFNVLVVVVLPQLRSAERAALRDYYWEIAAAVGELEAAAARMGLDPLRERLASAAVSADFFGARLAAGATWIQESCSDVPLPEYCE